MGVVLKRAVYFITCSGRMMYPVHFDQDAITRNLLSVHERLPREVRESISGYHQLSMFDDRQAGPWQIAMTEKMEVVL